MWQLFGILRNGESLKHDFHPDRLTIGRARTNSIQLEDETVSSLHAEIEQVGPGKYVLRDLGSKNGTFVEGVSITEAEISSPCKIAFGALTFEVKVGEEPETVTHPENKDLGAGAAALQREYAKKIASIEKQSKACLLEKRKECEELSLRIEEIQTAHRVDLENERRQLSEKIAEVEKQNEARLLGKQNEFEELRQSIWELKTAHGAELEKERQEHSEKTAELERRLLERQKEWDDLNWSIGELKAAHATELENQRRENSEKAAELERQNEARLLEKQKELEELNRSIEELKTAHGAALETERRESLAKVADLERQAEARLLEKQKESEELNRTNEELKGKHCVELENERQQHRERVANAERESEASMKRKQEECDGLNRAVEDLKKALREQAEVHRNGGTAESVEKVIEQAAASLKSPEPAPTPESVKASSEKGAPDSSPADKSSGSKPGPTTAVWSRFSRSTLASRRAGQVIRMFLLAGVLGFGLMCLLAQSLPSAVLPSMNPLRIVSQGKEAAVPSTKEESGLPGAGPQNGAAEVDPTKKASGKDLNESANEAPKAAASGKTESRSSNAVTTTKSAVPAPGCQTVAIEPWQDDQLHEIAEGFVASKSGAATGGVNTLDQKAAIQHPAEVTPPDQSAVAAAEPKQESGPATSLKQEEGKPAAPINADPGLDHKDKGSDSAVSVVEANDPATAPPAPSAGNDPVKGSDSHDLAKADLPNISAILHPKEFEGGKNSKEPHLWRVLILGDSLSLCGFGKRLDQAFRDDPQVQAVYTYMACGTHPLSWIKEKPYTTVKTHCGFWSIESSDGKPKEMEDTYGMTQGHVPKPHPVPKLEDLLDKLHPDILVMQCGTNLFSLFESRTVVQPAKDGPMVKNYIAPFLNAARKCASLKKMYWVSPPTSGRAPAEIQEFVYHETIDCAGWMATVIDSRPLVSYPYHHMEPDHEHFMGTDMTQWAERTYAFMKQDLASRPYSSLTALAQLQAPASAEPVKKAPDVEQQPLYVQAKLEFKSQPIPLKQLMPYQESLVSFVYDVSRVVNGKYEDKQILVLHPAYIGLKPQPLDKYKTGKTYNLRLHEVDATPWHTVRCQDESGRIDLIPYIQVEDEKKFPGNSH